MDNGNQRFKTLDQFGDWAKRFFEGLASGNINKHTTSEADRVIAYIDKVLGGKTINNSSEITDEELIEKLETRQQKPQHPVVFLLKGILTGLALVFILAAGCLWKLFELLRGKVTQTMQDIKFKKEMFLDKMRRQNEQNGTNESVKPGVKKITFDSEGSMSLRKLTWIETIQYWLIIVKCRLGINHLKEKKKHRNFFKWLWDDHENIAIGGSIVLFLALLIFVLIILVIHLEVHFNYPSAYQMRASKNSVYNAVERSYVHNPDLYGEDYSTWRSEVMDFSDAKRAILKKNWGENNEAILFVRDGLNGYGKWFFDPRPNFGSKEKAARAFAKWLAVSNEELEEFIKEFDWDMAQQIFEDKLNPYFYFQDQDYWVQAINDYNLAMYEQGYAEHMIILPHGPAINANEW